MSDGNVTPAGALRRLEEGNERFASGNLLSRDHASAREETADAQTPFAAVLGCIDSRVPPELVFDQGIGDLFVARIAGNFVNRDILGSLEFATAVAGARLIVILGHSGCGAVKGACDRVELGNLTAMLGQLEPAVRATQGFDEDRSSTNAAFVQAVSEENLRLTAGRMLEESAVLRGLVDEGRIQIRTAMYELSTGLVRWMDAAQTGGKGSSGGMS